MGVMLPSSSARSPGAELLWGWGAAVLVDDPEEADPVFPPTKNTPCVQPGVTGKAGCHRRVGTRQLRAELQRLHVAPDASAICVGREGVSCSGHWIMMSAAAK